MKEHAQTIRERVPMEALARQAGLAISRQGYVACPFHKEKTPSLKIYGGGGGWHCFGCGGHGSVIDFAMRFYGLTFPQAMVKLNADFALGLPIGRPTTLRERQAASQAQQRHRQEEADWAQRRQQAEDIWKAAFDRWLRLERDDDAGDAGDDAEDDRGCRPYDPARGFAPNPIIDRALRGQIEVLGPAFFKRLAGLGGAHTVPHVSRVTRVALAREEAEYAEDILREIEAEGYSKGYSKRHFTGKEAWHERGDSGGGAGLGL